MGRLSMPRERAVRLLERTGLARPARAAKARGWWFWIPLVPVETFFQACISALRDLRWHMPDKEIGDYLEFGVSRGTSLACMHRALEREGLAKVRLFGFDSFEGLPTEAADEGWRPGAFKSTLKATQTYLTRASVDWRRVTLIKGWFCDTLTPETRERLKIEKASVIMIDCDIESATRDALRFADPLIRDRAVMFLDDWDSDRRAGQRRAFEEFLDEHPEISAKPLPSYTRIARVYLLTRALIAGWIADNSYLLALA